MSQTIWKNGHLLPWEEATTHVLTHGLHYGSAVFEGIRFYSTAKGPAIFKLKEHTDRFFYSAAAIGMQVPFSKDEINAAIVQVVADNGIEEGYIRPLVYYGYGPLRITPLDNEFPIDVIIACWPWGAYLASDFVDIKVSKYIRIHPKSSVADAKISGHYVNSLIAGLELKGTHYHDALLLDSEGFVAEGTSNNVFMVKEGKLITTPCGTILEGITRNTIIDLARAEGIEVVEEKFTVAQLQHADEVFVCGTAAEVVPMRSLDDHVIGGGKAGPITLRIKSLYSQLVRGELEESEGMLTYIR